MITFGSLVMKIFPKRNNPLHKLEEFPLEFNITRLLSGQYKKFRGLWFDKLDAGIAIENSISYGLRNVVSPKEEKYLSSL